MALVYEFNSPPVKNQAFSFEMSLISQSDTDIFQVNPTLAAGDVKIIKDGVLDGNIDTLPTAVTSITQVITVTLSTDEMNANRVQVVFKDAAGDEWQDAMVDIRTVVATTVSDFDESSDTVTLADDSLTAAKIASNAITSDELAASAVSEIVTGVLTTAMTESYASDGATATLAQALYEIMQFHNERTVGETTITVKKRDGSTTAYTLTYDSDSITRSG